MNLSGIFAPVTTPFAADGSVALGDLRENISQYNRTALSGYIALGSTGEAVLLTGEEMAQVLATVRETAAPGKILIAGAGAESTAETIARCRQAAGLGYAVALVKPPCYYKPQLKPEVLVDHFRRVADASPIPVLLYSIQKFTGITIRVAEVAKLSEHKNIIGIKESSGDVPMVGEIVSQATPDFQTIVGAADMLLPSLRAGACGGILALADVLPELCVKLFRLARDENQDHARKLQQQLLVASNAIVSEGGQAGIKYAMDVRGYRGGLPRLPLPPMGEQERRAIERCIAALPSA